MTKRVAVVAGAGWYVGPELARVLAARGHDLVLADARDDLVSELRDSGADVETINGIEITDTGACDALLQAALGRFGRVDAATTSSGDIVVGRFTKSSLEDMQRVNRGCIEGPYNFLRAFVPQMVEQDDGQILILTSAAGARATPGAPLYSAARAGANMLIRNVAMEVAKHNVQVNAVGTNFMDFPGFLAANRVTDDESRAKVESMVPMNRLGSMEELAYFCAVFLDGTSRFTTGQFVPYAGGWA